MTLTVLAKQKHLLFQTMEKADYQCSEFFFIKDKVKLEFYEVRNAELEFLPKLQEQGVAYDCSWDRGVDFEQGTEHCRFTQDGEKIIKTIFADQLNPNLRDLVKHKDDPERLRNFILEFERKLEVLPWDNQIEYGKAYSLRQLITT